MGDGVRGQVGGGDRGGRFRGWWGQEVRIGWGGGLGVVGCRGDGWGF